MKTHSGPNTALRALLVTAAICVIASVACRQNPGPAGSEAEVQKNIAEEISQTGEKPPVLIIKRSKAKLEELQTELTRMHGQGYRIAGIASQQGHGNVTIILQLREKNEEQ